MYADDLWFWFMKGRVLIIAGSDSGGGAGVQGDIKTVSALGGYAATAITAITAQNTTGVLGVHAAPPEIVRAQIDSVLTDIGADAVKIGMVWSDAIVAQITAAYDAHGAGAPLVIDPVMQSTSGATLYASGAAGSVKAELFPRAYLITPNIPEAEILTGIEIETQTDMIHAAEMLLSLGPAAVLIKGGHLDGETIVDILLDETGMRAFAGARIASRNTHGTGCALAAAIATGLAQGRALEEAVERGRRFVQAAIAAAPGYGAGCGPLNHFYALESPGAALQKPEEVE